MRTNAIVLTTTRWSSVGIGFFVVVALAAGDEACQKRSSDASDPRSDVNDLFGATGALVVDGAPANAAALFAGVGAKDDGIAEPCMIEPEAGTLFPKNWLPPRFSWNASGSNANLFELRVHVEGQASDLVVYTAASSWTMPVETWSALQSAATDVPITVELRGAFYTGRGIQDLTRVGKADLAIAPIEAPGNIVYWSVGDGRDDSRLRGLTMTDEGVIEVLSGNEMPAYGQNDGQKCIGCHTATPDGKDVAVAWEKGSGGYVNDVAEIQKGTPAGPRPTYLSPAAAATLGTGNRTFTAFSPAHWKNGDRMLVTNDDADLVWVDLEATSEDKATGVLGSVGDPNPRRLGPSWTHDGKTIVYMSGQLGPVPFELTGPSDLYVMPYADRSGATAAAPAAPLAGAASPDTAEYYPTVSPDDTWVVFNALPDNGRLYDNPNAELFVVPRAGGTRTRLRANDPPACSGKTSPGVTNSWPKWAPAVQDAGGRKYYFVVFSSRRHPKTDKPQLYVSPMVVDASGAVTTYPAIYLRNQESFDGWERWGNHTPAWDDFAIAPDLLVK